MGYLSQRKKRTRENIFMLISLTILAIVYFSLFFENGENSFLSNFRAWQFHFYLYNLFLFVYTLWHRRVFYSLLAVLLLCLNYTSLAKTTRLFFSQEGRSAQTIEVAYKKDAGSYNFLPQIAEQNISRQGKIDLSQNLFGFYKNINQDNKQLTIIVVTFSPKYKAEFQTALNNLKQFVEMQDGPVILVGNFGLPSWAPKFRAFLRQTRLDVKNRILYTDGKESFKFWFVPDINVLGFDNVGIKNIEMKNKTLYFDLTF